MSGPLEQEGNTVMKILAMLGLAGMLAAGVVLAAGASDEAKKAEAAKITVNFDDVKAGELPKGWEIAATKPTGDLAEWKVEADEKAPSKPNVLALVKIKNPSDTAVFNLCWTKDVKFKNGTISLKIRANSGKVDQGGGPMWRVKDANNYYVARYNPLEKNFRLYYVKDGTRKQLAEAKDLAVPAGQWFTITVAQKGDKIECSLDGKKLLEATDATLPEAGGVGLWTKGDAATSFDDLEVASE
jgi:hypothetical protein